MTTDEMIEILEGIIRDKETNATARCTAIRTLMQIEDNAGSRELDEKSPDSQNSTRSRRAAG